MDEYTKGFMSLLDEQIKEDSLTEIKARKPGHSEPYYNNLLNKAQNVARSTNWKLSTLDVVMSKEFWQNNA